MHLWCASLDEGPERAERVLSMLSEDERQRAGRFRLREDRRHFIVARGLLRVILGRYLAAEPPDIRFHYNGYGKPALTRGPGHSGLRFNVSHSNGLAVYAFAQDRDVGVDVEYIRADVPIDEIAEKFFSLSENADLRAMPDVVRHEAFFCCWTRKEAYIKARGTGLSLPLDGFDVSIGPGDRNVRLRHHAEPEESARWFLYSAAPAPGYTGALAVEGAVRRLERWRWD